MARRLANQRSAALATPKADARSRSRSLARSSKPALAWVNYSAAAA